MTQLLWSGIVIGTVYALIGLSLTLIYRVARVVNFAQGEIMTYAALVVYTSVVLWETSWVVAIPSAVVVAAALGLAIDRLAVRPVWRFGGHHSHNWLLTTFGVSIVMQTTAQFVWGRFDLPAPSLFSREVVRAAGVGMTYREIAIVVIGVALVLLLELLNRSDFGRASQAVAENPTGAALIGLDASRIVTKTWAIAAVISAVAGILAAPILVLNAFMGFSVIVMVFAVVIIGGLGSPRGAIAAGYGIGIYEFLMARYLPGGYVTASIFVVVIVVLYVRPAGLFGQVQVERA